MTIILTEHIAEFDSFLSSGAILQFSDLSIPGANTGQNGHLSGNGGIRAD